MRKAALLIMFAVLVTTAFHISSSAQESYTYHANIKPITEGICKNCHEFATSYTTVMAKTGFVVPENPDSSEFVWRIEGRNAAGASITRMPNGGPYLSDATILIVRAWIAEGAPEGQATGVVEKTNWSTIKRMFK
jgi:hypothetical protein